jgi:phosphate/sulfate permease
LCFVLSQGANDVANSFGSSVAAGSLTLLQAIILGFIMELLGSILLGASVAGTIRGKVIDGSYYVNSPEIFMLGCTTALMAACVWLMIATYYGFAVSTTHDILAALIGFSIAAHGFQSIIWSETSKIFISWVTAPLLAGVIAYIFFFLLKKFVLLSPQEQVFERALKVFPLVVFSAITYVFQCWRQNCKTTFDTPSHFLNNVFTAWISSLFFIILQIISSH